MIFSQWAWKNPLPQGHDLTSIKAADERHGCAGGVNGTIMSTRNGGGWNGTMIKYTGGVLQSIPGQNGNRTVSCFPNPFQEYTSIRISLPSQQSVSIQVYDSKGNLVMLFTQKVYPPSDNV